MKANQPSSTARIIARSLILLSEDGRFTGLVNRSAVRLSRLFLDECSGGRDRLLSLLRYSWFRQILYSIERRILPGIFLHYAKRKNKIRKLVQQSIGQGYRQLVQLGAGYDTLALQLKEDHNIRCAEYDHPATQAIKIRALQRAGISLNRMAFTACDLQTDSIRDLSVPSALDPDRPTIVVAEGLLMYLQEQTVKDLLGTLSSRFHNRVRFIFTFLERGPRGQVDFHRNSRLLHLWLRSRKEAFQWGCPASEIPAFMQGCGLAVSRVYDPGGSDDPNTIEFTHSRNEIGEYICVADTQAGTIREDDDKYGGLP